MNTEFNQNIAPQQAEETPAYTAPVQEQATEPVGFWAFLGMMALFAIPVIGFIACIVFMFAPQKKSMKNYARAAFTWMILGLTVTVLTVTMIAGAIGSMILPTINDQFGTEIDSIFEVVGMASDLMKGNYSALIDQFREPLLEAMGEEYAPILDELASGKYDEIIEQVKEGDYDDILEDLNEGKYQELVDQIDKEDYAALRKELESAAKGEPSQLFDEIRGYLNAFPIG